MTTPQDHTEGSSMEKCPTCGTTIIKFDPPLYFEADEMCGAIKPGNYATGGPPIPVCNLAQGHDGHHVGLMEYHESWEPS
jgi:hypothetical protein